MWEDGGPLRRSRTLILVHTFFPLVTVTERFSPDGFQDVSLQSSAIPDHGQMESVYLIPFYITDKHVK